LWERPSEGQANPCRQTHPALERTSQGNSDRHLEPSSCIALTCPLTHRHNVTHKWQVLMGTSSAEMEDAENKTKQKNSNHHKPKSPPTKHNNNKISQTIWRQHPHRQM
ncbi:unnamed protein product, partial [Gulo gulo]